MDKKRVFPALVCGFGASVLNTIPGIKNLGCCLIVPLAVIFAMFLDYRINKSRLPLDLKTALMFGILTGLFVTLFSTFFEVLITFITRTNDFVEALPQTEMLIRQYKLGVLFDQTMSVLHQMVDQIKANGFSLLYTAGIFTSNLVINSVFGLLGGIIGMAYLNKRANL